MDEQTNTDQCKIDAIICTRNCDNQRLIKELRDSEPLADENFKINTDCGGCIGNCKSQHSILLRKVGEDGMKQKKIAPKTMEELKEEGRKFAKENI